MHTQAGTPYYASPEIWANQDYTSKSDVWSLGCLLYEITCLKLPFTGKDLSQLHKNISKGIYHKIPGHYSMELASTIQMLLNPNPNKRLSCKDILQSDFINKNLTNTLRELDFSLKPNELLASLKETKNIKKLQMQLPKPRYQEPSYLPLLRRAASMRSL
jgi:NIMA (never in mitosis gene a)-related kinase 1/4/5